VPGVVESLGERGQLAHHRRESFGDHRTSVLAGRPVRPEDAARCRRPSRSGGVAFPM
jgi:hypothetical protein